MAFPDSDPRAASTLYDKDGNAVEVTMENGVYRLAVTGLVAVVGQDPPPGTTPVVITADTPLVVSTADTVYVIPDGQTYFLQEIVAGNEDPTKGAVTEVIYDENGTEHLIGRQYTAGFTEPASQTATGCARDLTKCIGNAGGTFKIIVRRTKYAGSPVAIDAEARGYVTIV